MSSLPRLFNAFLLIAFVFVFTSLASSVCAQVYAYDVEELGALPGDASSQPWAINGMEELFGLPGQTYAIASGINDAGVVVGDAWGGGTLRHALRWTAGVPEDLGALAVTSRALDVSDAGDVVGETPVESLDSKAFLYTDAGGMELIAPLSYTSHAYDINEWGEAVGYMTVLNAYHAFRFTPGAGLQDLGVVSGFSHSFGKAINVSGQVAGSLTSATGNSEHIFRYTDGVGIVDLGGVGETNQVWAINSRGDIVGRGRPSSGIERAFLYTDEGGLQDFDDLIDVSAGWHLHYANDINDAGQIVGIAYNSIVGGFHGVRLTPTTPVGPLTAISMVPTCLEGGTTGSGWVTVTQAAPPGGATIALATNDPGVVTVPSGVTIAEGQRHASFTVTTATVNESTGPVSVSAEYDNQVRTATVEVTPPAITGIDDGPNDVPFLRVDGAAPNPTLNSSWIRYELLSPSNVELRVYDVAGRLVRTLVDSRQTSGVHPVRWDGRDNNGVVVPSGTYFFRIKAGRSQESGKLVLLH
jgi:probable HAF family extracellular repeat protein